MVILINSSKTMGHNAYQPGSQTPSLLAQAMQLATVLARSRPDELAQLMHISPSLALKTKIIMQNWLTQPQTTAALDAFQGDIFKGLRAQTFTTADREYANRYLKIISGLYGILQPFDAIKPYRLELAYQLQVGGARNLYDFWKDAPSTQLPAEDTIIQLASQEYFRLLEPYIDTTRVITPQFMTQLPGQKEPTFVTVHAKATRGAFARWLILNRIHSPKDIVSFNELGYQYVKGGTENSPLFVTKQAIKPTQLR